MMLGRILIYIGVIVVLAGFLLTLLESAGFLGKFGRLPGDILIRKGNTTIFIPITTSLIISVILSLLFFLIRK